MSARDPRAALRLCVKRPCSTALRPLPQRVIGQDQRGHGLGVERKESGCDQLGLHPESQLAQKGVIVFYLGKKRADPASAQIR